MGLQNGSTKWGTCDFYKMGSTKWGLIQPGYHNQHKYFSTNCVYGHVCSPTWSLQNGCWKLSRSTTSQSTSSTKWHWVLRRGSIYKMGSTKWVAQPHLPSKRGGNPVYFAHDPTHFVEETGGGWICQLVNYSISAQVKKSLGQLVS